MHQPPRSHHHCPWTKAGLSQGLNLSLDRVRAFLPGSGPRLQARLHSPAVMFLFNPKVTFLELDGVLLSCRRKKTITEVRERYKAAEVPCLSRVPECSQVPISHREHIGEAQGPVSASMPHQHLAAHAPGLSCM